MSKDIRLFFSSKKVQKPKVEESDDVIPESPDVQIKNKKKESRKKRVLSDSDEEIFDSKKKRTNENLKNKPKSKISGKSALKEVKAVDIFGSAPIKRCEPIVKKVKDKKNTETGIHSDDEFDKSLLELDAVEEVAIKPEHSPKKANSNKTTPKKSNIDKQHTPMKHSKTTNKESEAQKSDSKKKSPVKSKEIHNVKEQIKSEQSTKSNSSHQKTKSKVDNSNKRKFAEFVEDNDTVSNTDGDKVKKYKLENNVTESCSTKDIVKIEPKNDFNDTSIINDSMNESLYESKKSKRGNKSLNESVLTDEERYERKVHSAALYKKYLNRSGPKHLGSKEMPEGAPDCLKDFAVLFTGVLDSFERDEIVEVITKYGGCIKNSISKKVTHVLAGDEPGPAKLAKAEELGIKIINEDEFLDIIKNSKRNNSDKKKDKNSMDRKSKNKSIETLTGIDKKSSEKLNKSKEDIKKSNTSSKGDKKNKGINPKVKVESPKKEKVKIESPKKEKVKTEVKLECNKEIPKDNFTDKIGNENKSDSCNSNESSEQTLMWVDKHKPQSIKNIIGQRGEASNVTKLTNWLTKWYINRKAKLPKPSPWAKNDDGGYFKAALLSGPPGVGKTTTVSLVCKELGFDMVEFNASDTRNKTLIKEQISELLSTTSLSGFARGNTGKQAVTKKHVLVMDEVDGMAGNEDRGGLQELIILIKSTSIPIICMCNDRNSQKMRSLVNYCYDLRFSRPRVDQIKSGLMTVCFKENLKISSDELTQLIVSANQDVRQSLHLLSLWAAGTAGSTMRHCGRKDIKLGPWEAIRKVFSKEDHKTMSINDRSDLFFYDYSLAPLFVQENYLQVQPHCPKNEILDRVSKAADSISMGDLVDARIRGNQSWSMLPIQAMYSSVLPGQAMAGHVGGQIQFPSWLGRNSRAMKMKRLAHTLHAHARLSTSGSKQSMFLDYATHLRDAIVNPLIQDKTDGITKSMEVLESYHLLRDDLDSLTEISLWPGQRNPMVLIDSKVKAAMTRAYNKSAAALPYAPPTAKKGRSTEDNHELADGEEEGEDSSPEDSDPENDALVKKKKTEKPVAEKKSGNKEKPSSSKEKKTKKK